MIASQRLVTRGAAFTLTSARTYTCIVERIHKPLTMKIEKDQRKTPLKSKHYQYKLVDCLHVKPWGNIDLILTQFVEGVGHKGEIVNVTKHQAYYELLPAQLAVYPTEEYMEMYKKDRESIVTKSKVSPYAMKAREQIEKMIIDVPMNMDAEWKLTVDNIRIALRYKKIMSRNECIEIPSGLEITSKTKDLHNKEFMVKLKINDYVTANVKCKVVPMNSAKLWEEFTAFNKTI